MRNQRPLACLVACLAVGASGVAATIEADQKEPAQSGTAVLWRDPGTLAVRDLRYGPGSPDRMPHQPFTFLAEDKSGESPKFTIRDANNVEWSVKLGVEAQTETVATRLVWAVGYFAEETYYIDRVAVRNLPRLSRGQEFVTGRGMVRGARFEARRKEVERGPTWDWNNNPFAGTAELSGLKVLMILLNNYDARTNNNRILYVRTPETSEIEVRYVVSDLGATLGRADGLGGRRSKNDLNDYLSTRFVVGVENGAVKFDYGTRPRKLGVLSILYPPYYIGEVKKEKSMRGIPVAHAHWIGSLLSQLSNEQLRDAFRAANYDSKTIRGYVRALRQRVSQLTRLPGDAAVEKDGP